MFIDMAANDIQTVYLAGSSSASYPTVIKTVNAGNSWTHVLNTASNQNIRTGWSGQTGDRNWGYGECAFGLEVAPNNATKSFLAIMDLCINHRMGVLPGLKLTSIRVMKTVPEMPLQNINIIKVLGSKTPHPGKCFG